MKKVALDVWGKDAKELARSLGLTKVGDTAKQLIVVDVMVGRYGRVMVTLNMPEKEEAEAQ